MATPPATKYPVLPDNPKNPDEEPPVLLAVNVTATDWLDPATVIDPDAGLAV